MITLMCTGKIKVKRRAQGTWASHRNRKQFHCVSSLQPWAIRQRGSSLESDLSNAFARGRTHIRRHARRSQPEVEAVDPRHRRSTEGLHCTHELWARDPMAARLA